MNKLIFRKLSYDILAFFVLSSMAISLIVWVVQGVNLLDIVSEDGHGIKIYFIYTLLNLPKIFSKLLIFTYFLTLFVIFIRYENNNEILVFWTNGINKISFINFIGKFSLLFVIIQLVLNLFIVPYSKNLGQEYLKNSSIDFFPKLIQEKKFSNVMQNLTIFVEEYKKDGSIKGIYIKEKLENNENKIITANEGKLVKNEYGFNFKLLNGRITNIDNRGSFNLNFKETIYDISKLNNKIRKQKKLDETKTVVLVNCLNKFLEKRKDKKLRCNNFLLSDIYEEAFKRVINPIYIIVLSLISSLLILKPKVNILQNYYKSLLFIIGFIIIILSELSHKFIKFTNLIEIATIILPLILIFLFYIGVIIKSKFKPSYL